MAKALDERQWHSFVDVARLLHHLRRSQNAASTKIGRRKLRLFACACCRTLLWSLPAMIDEYAAIVALAEQVAEGSVEKMDLLAKAMTHRRSLWSHIANANKNDYHINNAVASAMVATIALAPAEAAHEAASYAVEAVLHMKMMTGKEAKRQAAEVLREIFGNPFQPFAAEEDWLSWKDGIIPAMAQQIYQERRFDEVPILGDALEDAGCRNQDILDHCRQPKHFLGCWVVDGLLGKG